MSWIGTQAGYQDCIHHNYYLSNIYEAAYQVYIAAEEGRSYSGIDSFEAALGKRILCVMADNDADSPVFYTIDFPWSKHENCFSCNLYFIFDSGYLVCTHYASVWVDNALPGRQFVDVSSAFSQLVGSRIEEIEFEHNTISKGTTNYGQPVIMLHMDNGSKLNFTINFGEVEKADRCAYFYYGEKRELSAD